MISNVSKPSWLCIFLLSAVSIRLHIGHENFFVLLCSHMRREKLEIPDCLWVADAGRRWKISCATVSEFSHIVDD